MSAADVHAAIAAALSRPSDAVGGALDAAVLRKFAGMTLKVRHNQLREQLPLTFRLLNVAGLEIELFSAYALSRTTHAPTTEERTRDLLAFVERWADPRRREHVLLWDLIRHELALATLASAPADDAPPSRVPRIRGAIVLHEMQCDPRAVAAALAQSKPPLDDVGLAPRHVCYWRLGNAMQIVELDAFGFHALSLIDGTRSVAAISEAMLGKRRPGKVFLRLLGELRVAGLIR